MRVQKCDGAPERRVLTGMIVSDSVLARVAAAWGDGDRFADRWCNTVGGWCVKYHRRYGKAPGKAVQGMFEAWAARQADEAPVALVEGFLTSLSGAYRRAAEEINADYVVDQAAALFNEVEVRRAATRALGHADAGELEPAKQALTGFRGVELGGGAGVDLFQSEAAVTDAFSREALAPLVAYDGSLGKFFRNALVRDGFLAFTGPQKSSKSYWLRDLAWRAMTQRRRVAYFEVGDHSEREAKELWLVRAARHPVACDSEDGRWPWTVPYPVSITYAKGADCAEVTTEDLTFDGPLTRKRAWRVCGELRAKTLKSEESFLRLSCHPNLSISVLGLRAQLEAWDAQDWTPDVVVIDYADNLAPADKREEPRDRVNTTWKLLRSLAMERHCLLVTATQVNAREGFSRKTLDRTCFSEDNRKLNHVTGLVGINVMPEEKERGISRLNWIVKRKGKYDVRRCVHVAGCLAVGDPAVVSTGF